MVRDEFWRRDIELSVANTEMTLTRWDFMRLFSAQFLPG